MAGRGVAQAVGQAVEDHDAHRDELLGSALGRQGGVELLESLGRVTELAEEHAQQVLDLEGGDRGLDAVPGHVADHSRKTPGADREEVVEVAGHEAGAGLVHVADFVAFERRQVLGREAGGPAAGRQLGLGQDLLGAALELGALLGQPGLVLEAVPVDEGQGNGDEHQVGGDVEEEVLRHRRHAEGHSRHAVEERGVQLLAVGGAGQVGTDRAGRPFGDPTPRPVEVHRRAAPHHGGDEAPDGHGQQEGPDHTDGMVRECGTLSPPGAGPGASTAWGRNRSARECGAPGSARRSAAGSGWRKG